MVTNEIRTTFAAKRPHYGGRRVVDIALKERDSVVARAWRSEVN